MDIPLIIYITVAIVIVVAVVIWVCKDDDKDTYEGEL